MYIKRVCYPVTVLGSGNRVGIWFTGCERDCPDCLSPELRNMKSGAEVSVSQVRDMMNQLPSQPDGVTISGGEPFLQARELDELTATLSELTDDIIVYTGYTLEQLREQSCVNTNAVLSRIAVLIDGEYVAELNDGRGIRGSSNQRIHIFKNAERYNNLDSCERTQQTFSYDGQILVVGIQ